jgi:hypothetical protein
VHPQFLFRFPYVLSTPRPHFIFLVALLGLKPKEQVFCSLLYPLNLSNTDYGAKCYTRAECNTILYDSLPLEAALYLYTSVLYVCVRVCVCDPDMALLAPILNTPLLLYPSPDR